MPSLMLLLMLLMLLMLMLPPSVLCCFGNNSSIGYTIPKSAINVEAGQPFNITCVVNPGHSLVAGYGAGDLYFVRKDVLPSGTVSTKVPAQRITRLNSTAIMVTSRLQTEVKHMYQCYLNRRQLSTTGVCMTDVNIGRLPVKIKGFRCISYNWNNVTCRWEEPFNAIKTKYDVKYILKTFHPYVKECKPTSSVLREAPPGGTVLRSCVVEKGDFRSTHEHFKMSINASNALGAVSFDPVLLETYAIVLPAPPKSLWVSNTSSRALQLHVAVEFPMYVFPKRVQFQVIYTSRWHPEPVTVDAGTMAAVLSTEERTRSLNVLALLPYTNYTFDVRIRSSHATGDDMWSEPAQATFTTLPEIPSEAPTTTPSSFELVGQRISRSVYVYWRQIAARQRNGPHFKYCVTAWQPGGDQILDMKPDKVAPAYARYTNVTLQSVTFRVRSCNEEGESLEEANLTVPARENEILRPHSVTLVVTAENRYQLSWEQRDQQQPDSYTVFWCEFERGRPYQCEGQLDWESVPGDRREHTLNITTGAEYQFAVAANRAGISSGMSWSHCTLLADGGGVQVNIKLYIEERSAQHLVLAWYSECSGRAVVPEYIVYYCQLNRGRCQGAETRLVVGATSAPQQNANVTGLAPYTDYRLSVAPVTGGTEGQRLATIDEPTIEAPPEPPQRLLVTALSNTSMEVRWSPPTIPNGVLEYYTVETGDQPPVSVPANETELTLTELQVYTGYSVSVKACNTAGCSLSSKPATGRTLQGVPGPMELPRVELLNVSAVRVRWKPPVVVGGPAPVYQLRIVSEREGENQTSQVALPVGKTVADLPVPECEPGSDSQRHLFSIRATGVLPSEERLVGPWSEWVQQNCVLASDWPTATIIGVVMGGALLMMLVVLVFFMVCSKTRRKLTEMRNLGVNLPPGLDRLEKPPLSSFPGSERRPGEGHSYGRLVSQNSAATDRTNTSVSGQPLLQEDHSREECEGDSSDRTPPPQTDSNSCSSSTTNYNDSGAECDKVPPSPTFNGFSWPSVADPASNITPYVQVGGPETTIVPPITAAAPAYSKFSPYVDAKGMQALMARSLSDIAADNSGCSVSRSVPDLAQAGDASGEPPSVAPYSQIAHGSSTGYVSMTSDDGVVSPRPPATHQRPGASPTPAQETKLPVPTPTPPAQCKPCTKPAELKPYVTLGPPPPPASAAGFPPYVLAGPPAGAAEVPAPVAACSPAHSGGAASPAPSPLTWARPRDQQTHSAPTAGKHVAPANAELPTRQLSSAGYVAHDKLNPAGIELTDIPASATTNGYVSHEALRGDGTCSAEPVLSPKKLPTVASSRDPYCRVVTTHQGPPDLGPNVSMV